MERKYNPHTGYIWDISLSPNLSLVQVNYAAPSFNAPEDTPEIIIWTISSNKPGNSYIMLWYHKKNDMEDTSKIEVVAIETSIKLNIQYNKGKFFL